MCGLNQGQIVACIETTPARTNVHHDAALLSFYSLAKGHVLDFQHVAIDATFNVSHRQHSISSDDNIANPSCSFLFDHLLKSVGYCNLVRAVFVPETALNMEEAYCQSTDAVLKHFSVSPGQGLSEAQVKSSRDTHGPNCMSGCMLSRILANLNSSS